MKVLGSRSWLRRTHPFPHVIARDVMAEPFYADLSAQMRDLVDVGVSEIPAPGRLSRNLPGYDCYALGFNNVEASAPTSFFASAEWRDLICARFDVGRTPYVFAGAHHHAIGSANGFVHNDLNPVWFPRAEPDVIQTPDAARCEYKTGVGSLLADRKIEVVRGVAVLYFLLNDDWHPGDGGEIGLYRSARTPVDQPAIRCPPINNSMVAFECTPRSYHAYLSNVRRPRTSIIMWVHRSHEEACARHGAETLERWTS